ncbi:MAG: type II toxin-antitoxin system HicA family toxin [Nitrospirota bacterium]|nr:type II toxin-antitoxin system HicA family toxin [Nitrospirota bacterium]MDH5768149.1 type II toxin-antitoxin system HicA family toxin [Nitrospirota bacterium]
MGQRQPRVTADEIIRVLKSLGFERVDQAGSHQKWKHPLTGKQAIVSYHSGEIIRPKTFKKILEGAGLTVDDFIKIRMKL